MQRLIIDIIQMITNIIQSTPFLGLVRRVRFSIVIVNEYKFYIDFKGVMHFDEGTFSLANAIRDKKFINKFYQVLKKNDEGVNQDYPYLAEFWGEKNYLRFSIAPIVYSNLS